MSSENKSLVRRCPDECLGTNDMSLMDTLLAPTCVWHAPSGDFDLHASKQFQPSVLAAFPDGYWTTEDKVAEGRIAEEWETWDGAGTAQRLGRH